MKFLILFLISLAVFGCRTEAPLLVVSGMEVVSPEVPNVAWSSVDVYLNKSNSTWYLIRDSSLASGYVNAYFTTGQLFRKFGLVNGKKEGAQQTYFPNGRLQFDEVYRTNRLHGTVKRWSLQNGYQLVALLQYQNGKPHGTQKKWYNTGELHKHLNLVEGREDGLQQAFRKNGALYANYEAKNGRVFGFKRSNLCYELDNEQVVFTQ